MTYPSLDALVREHDRLVRLVSDGELAASEEERALEEICVIECLYVEHPDRPIEDALQEASA